MRSPADVIWEKNLTRIRKREKCERKRQGKERGKIEIKG
jgi:hypothetical protein